MLSSIIQFQQHLMPHCETCVVAFSHFVSVQLFFTSRSRLLNLCTFLMLLVILFDMFYLQKKRSHTGFLTINVFINSISSRVLKYLMSNTKLSYPLKTIEGESKKYIFYITIFYYMYKAVFSMLFYTKRKHLFKII